MADEVATTDVELVTKEAETPTADLEGGEPALDLEASEAVVEKESTHERSDRIHKAVLPQLAFPIICFVFEIVMVFVYAFGATYDDAGGAPPTADSTTPNTDLRGKYAMFQDVHVMIFIGFGFLMTFLKKYGYSSVGLNFVVAAVVIQWSIVSNSFWHQVFGGETEWHKVSLGIDTLITADFAAAAVLITFGALLGKVTPAQLIIIALIEIVFYGINENIGVGQLHAVDVGGSMFVHTFGAYFGLACSLALGLSNTRKQGNVIGALGKATLCAKEPERKAIAAEADTAEENNASTKNSDMFAMIGTIFLWLFWPSFNGALASGEQQHRVVVNTVLSLSACCVSAFLFSALLRGLQHQIATGGDHSHYKFDMVDIQNATLAGGVAIGSAADLVVGAWGAIVVGFLAGLLSVAGYVFIGPFLAKSIGLHDTCGVHNLHGMPGVLGALVGALASALATDEIYGTSISTVFPERTEGGRTAATQGGIQLAALAITVAIAVLSGFATGLLIRIDNWWFLSSCKLEVCCSQKALFDDAEYWNVPDEEAEVLSLIANEAGAPVTAKV